MEPATISATRIPKYVYPEIRTQEVRTRGFVISKPEGDIIIGEATDISKYVQNYLLNNESGELTVNLKPEITLKYHADGELNVKLSHSAIFAIDAVLNQLAIAIFEIPVGNQETKVIGLLNGNSQVQPPLKMVKGMQYTRDHYDDHSQRKIDFSAIHDFAFDRTTYQILLDGSRFSIKLKEEYKDHPSVLYILNDVLGRRCGMTQKL